MNERSSPLCAMRINSEGHGAAQGAIVHCYGSRLQDVGTDTETVQRAMVRPSEQSSVVQHPCIRGDLKVYYGEGDRHVTDN